MIDVYSKKYILVDFFLANITSLGRLPKTTKIDPLVEHISLVPEADESKCYFMVNKHEAADLKIDQFLRYEDAIKDTLKCHGGVVLDKWITAAERL